MGADEAIHVKVSDEDYATLQPLAVAKILSEVTKQQKADLVIVGKQVKMPTRLPVLLTTPLLLPPSGN